MEKPPQETPLTSSPLHAALVQHLSACLHSIPSYIKSNPKQFPILTLFPDFAERVQAALTSLKLFQMKDLLRVNNSKFHSVGNMTSIGFLNLTKSVHQQLPQGTIFELVESSILQAIIHIVYSTPLYFQLPSHMYTTNDISSITPPTPQLPIIFKKYASGCIIPLPLTSNPTLLHELTDSTFNSPNLNQTDKTDDTTSTIRTTTSSSLTLGTPPFQQSPIMFQIDVARKFLNYQLVIDHTLLSIDQPYVDMMVSLFWDTTNFSRLEPSKFPSIKTNIIKFGIENSIQRADTSTKMISEKTKLHPWLLDAYNRVNKDFTKAYSYHDPALIFPKGTITYSFQVPSNCQLHVEPSLSDTNHQDGELPQEHNETSNTNISNDDQTNSMIPNEVTTSATLTIDASSSSSAASSLSSSAASSLSSSAASSLSSSAASSLSSSAASSLSSSSSICPSQALPNVINSHHIHTLNQSLVTPNTSFKACPQPSLFTHFPLFTMAPIAHISSCYKEQFGIPRQSPLSPHNRAIIHIRPDVLSNDNKNSNNHMFDRLLPDLHKYSHLWVNFIFHDNYNTAINEILAIHLETELNHGHLGNDVAERLPLLTPPPSKPPPVTLPPAFRNVNTLTTTNHGKDDTNINSTARKRPNTNSVNSKDLNSTALSDSNNNIDETQSIKKQRSFLSIPSTSDGTPNNQKEIHSIMISSFRTEICSPKFQSSSNPTISSNATERDQKMDDNPILSTSSKPNHVESQFTTSTFQDFLAPCRFNPLGQSLVKIEAIDTKNGLIFISGHDLLHHTLVLDLKPLHLFNLPLYQTVTFPQWVFQNYFIQFQQSISSFQQPQSKQFQQFQQPQQPLLLAPPGSNQSISPQFSSPTIHTTDQITSTTTCLDDGLSPEMFCNAHSCIQFDPFVLLFIQYTFWCQYHLFHYRSPQSKKVQYIQSRIEQSVATLEQHEKVVQNYRVQCQLVEEYNSMVQVYKPAPSISYSSTTALPSTNEAPISCDLHPNSLKSLPTPLEIEVDSANEQKMLPPQAPPQPPLPIPFLPNYTFFHSILPLISQHIDHNCPHIKDFDFARTSQKDKATFRHNSATPPPDQYHSILDLYGNHFGVKSFDTKDTYDLYETQEISTMRQLATNAGQSCWAYPKDLIDNNTLCDTKTHSQRLNQPDTIDNYLQGEYHSLIRCIIETLRCDPRSHHAIQKGTGEGVFCIHLDHFVLSFYIESKQPNQHCNFAHHSATSLNPITTKSPWFTSSTCPTPSTFTSTNRLHVRIFHIQYHPNNPLVSNPYSVPSQNRWLPSLYGFEWFLTNLSHSLTLTSFSQAYVAIIDAIKQQLAQNYEWYTTSLFFQQPMPSLSSSLLSSCIVQRPLFRSREWLIDLCSHYNILLPSYFESFSISVDDSNSSTNNNQ